MGRVIYGSVCSGIEAASVAFEPLGWRPAFLSEIDSQARAVLAHHWPQVPLRGDFTEIQAGDHDAIDLLVGGTPCQSFSVAGLRGGLADERGNLALEFLRLADRLRPRWIVWENVPGVLSATSHNAPDPRPPTHDVAEGTEWVGEDEYDADEDHAFACFLAGLSDLGYGWAYRNLDAQYFGLAQRRERVFVVGYLGDWRRAAAVLFEPASLRWDLDGGLIETVAEPMTFDWQAGGGGLDTSFRGKSRSYITDKPGRTRALTANKSLAVVFGGNNTSGPIDIAPALNACGTASGRQDFESEAFVTSTLVSNGDAHSGLRDEHGLVPVSIALRGRAGGATAEVGDDAAFTLRASTGGGDKPHVLTFAVHRLTPRECERLQGFPDNYTQVSWRGKPMANGPRYRMLGNSMAVPVMAWIGKRIAAQDSSLKPPEDALPRPRDNLKHVKEQFDP